MNIAIVHNYYGKLSGEETVIENLAALLVKRGVSVCRFSRSSAEIEEKLSGKMAAFFSGIHNPFAAKAFAEFLKSNRPDVVHIHNLYPLISPSILPVCKALGVPVVMTVHNFRLVCPNGLLLSKGEICHRCVSGREYWCVLRNCENDIFKSTGYALRTAAARRLRRYYDNVDHFICLSEFQKNILVGEGLPAERVSVLGNPVSFDIKIPPAPLYGKGEITVATKDSGQKKETFAEVHKTENNNTGSSGIPRHTPGVAAGLCPQARSGVTNGMTLRVHPPSIPPIKGGKNADDRGMDPPAFAGLRRQVHEGVTNGVALRVHPPSIPPVKGGKNADDKREFEEDGGYVAYVGRISPEKDIFTLMETARRLGDMPFKFAGDYHRMPEVLKQKPANCDFLGQLSAEEIAKFYSNARMVVFATRCYEGFPTVLLEAMSYGLPIVCSRIGGLPEIVENGVNGLLYEPGNANELAARIQTLWEDAELCEKLGNAGRQKLNSEYDAEKLMDRILEIYEKVIKEKKG